MPLHFEGTIHIIHILLYISPEDRPAGAVCGVAGRPTERPQPPHPHHRRGGHSGQTPHTVRGWDGQTERHHHVRYRHRERGR